MAEPHGRRQSPSAQERAALPARVPRGAPNLEGLGEVEDHTKPDQDDADQEDGFLAGARWLAACTGSADHRVAAGGEHPDDEQGCADEVVRTRDAACRVVAGAE